MRASGRIVSTTVWTSAGRADAGRVRRACGGDGCRGGECKHENGAHAVSSFVTNVTNHGYATRARPIGRSADPRCVELPTAARRYSHSIVAGGFDVTSSTTRFTPAISLTIRPEIVSIRSYGSLAQSAVIASSLVTARITTG